MNGAIDQIFATLEHAAVMGERCPENGTAGFDSDDLYELAQAGRIRVEVFGLNWRVVTLLTGRYAGRSTQACPHKSKRPWRVTDATGTHYPLQEERQQAAAPTTRRQPSAPRPLTREEIEL